MIPRTNRPKRKKAFKSLRRANSFPYRSHCARFPFLPQESNLRNEISNFEHVFGEYRHEPKKISFVLVPSWFLPNCTHLIPFYNALNPTDQDSLNSAADGNLLERSTRDVLTIIENKSKVRNSRNKSIVSQVKSSDVNSSSPSEIAKLNHAVNRKQVFCDDLHDRIFLQVYQGNTPPPASVKAYEEILLTCGGFSSLLSVSHPQTGPGRNTVRWRVTSKIPSHKAQENEPLMDRFTNHNRCII
ncbi:hypothetical protein Tco_0462447 [Tanacetum coccineum]